MSVSGNGNGNGDRGGSSQEIAWEEHRARVERAPAEVREALHEALERDQVVIATQQRYLAQYERDRREASQRHGEVIGEIARLCDLVAGALRVEDRVAALERAQAAGRRQRLAVLEGQAERQRRDLEGVSYDPESTGVRRLASTEEAIEELRRELLTHTAREEARDKEDERRRSLSEAQQVEQQRERRADTRAALRWIGGVVGAVVLLVASWLLGRLTGQPVDLHPLGGPEQRGR